MNMKILAVAIILVVLGVDYAVAQPWNGMMGGFGGGMMDGYGYGMGYGTWGILGLIFWVLVIIGLVLLIKYLWEGGGIGGGAKREQESALEILKRRYARGEINKEEFEEKKKDLL